MRLISPRLSGLIKSSNILQGPVKLMTFQKWDPYEPLKKEVAEGCRNQVMLILKN